MGLDIVVSFGILLALLYFVVWGDWVRPHLPVAQPRRVKNYPPPAAFKQRSKRSKRSNAFKQRSAQQNAETPPAERSAERSPGAAATPAAAPLQLSAKELTQLVNAHALIIQGRTEQEALETAFSCSKGGGKGWKRAKELFDLVETRP
jgi:hypothetical protein